ncbi:hypothetical protein ALQ72_100818 [Pseudomonas syringae pv. maculicola]|uniref:SMI1/KNR4 family protein n=1 Tax=Pseudomonas syringae pv. maculicola TaxID=59511 RepID=A0A3M3GF00_PSEYM|nr:hypothetical protein ALQ72_100818 [Pseudomonas syringae pv. maculicola]RMV26957.1 hypothetical protein ALP13_103631 [Pseudomonas syringae pv. maculicola]
MKELPEHSVYFSASELPEGTPLPIEWAGFGLGEKQSDWLPSKWHDFSSFLPNVYLWLNKCVIGTAVAISERPYLVYIYTEDGELNLYLGGAPLNALESTKELSPLIESLQSFYTQLHDGFIFYIDHSMGPSRVQDFVNIHDLCDDICPTGPELTAFFSSGAGDYMAVDKNSSPPANYIWWHEKQDCPDVDIDTWPTMDAWMGIFLENSDSNESILE